MTGIDINDPDDVKSGLEKAYMHEDPVLVSIQTDPNALAMPPKLEFDIDERCSFIHRENDVKRAYG